MILQCPPGLLLAFKYITHTVVDTSKSVEEKRVSKTVKDGTEISKVV